MKGQEGAGGVPALVTYPFFIKFLEMLIIKNHLKGYNLTIGIFFTVIFSTGEYNNS